MTSRSLRSQSAFATRSVCAALVLALAASPASVSVAQSNINLPNLGDDVSDVLSPSAERRLGERVMTELRNERDIFEDAELTDYLNELGLELAAASSSLNAGGAVAASDFQFFAVHDASINAFALPGGFIGVHTGLIGAAQTESELASVLSHEIGHVTQRHIARKFAGEKGSMLTMVGALLLAILAARSNSSSSGNAAQAAIAVGQGAAIQQQLNFSRDAEREADRVGFQTLVKAGYEAHGMVDFFTRLQTASRVYDAGNNPYLRTHPLTVERISDIQHRVRQERYRQKVDRYDFFLARARVRALEDTTVTGLREARTALQTQASAASKGRNPQAAAAWYGLAITQLALNDIESAAQSVAEARKRGDAHPFVEKLAAEVQIAKRDNAAAVATVDAARQRWPSSRTLRLYYAQALQAADQHPKAVTYLRDQAQLYRGDTALYELMGRSYAAIGDSAREHQATAEVYRLRGALRGAVDQLEIARKFARGTSNEDLNLATEIEARLREVRAQLQEELKDPQRNRG